MAEASSWPGFSEEELQKIRLQDSKPSDAVPKETKRSSLKSKLKKRNSVTFQTSAGCKTSVELESSEMNSIDKTAVANNHDEKVQIRMNDDGTLLQVTSTKVNCKDDREDVEIADTTAQDTCCQENSKINELENKLNSNELSNLEKFQMRQQFMEEKNKQRRALLTQAIVNRQKRTQEESEKLQYIQKEMIKLDNLVSNDVAILRDQIEHASIEFSISQKRYKKAEEEFVQAKIELFKKLERKEQLTEHLCTIIEQNEQRKGEKLIQLMKELEIEVFHDDLCRHEDIVIPPQLQCINETTMYRRPVPKDVHIINTFTSQDYVQKEVDACGNNGEQSQEASTDACTSVEQSASAQTNNASSNEAVESVVSNHDIS